MLTMFGDISTWELTCVLEDLSLLCGCGLLHAHDLQEVRSDLIDICLFSCPGQVLQQCLMLVDYTYFWF